MKYNSWVTNMAISRGREVCTDDKDLGSSDGTARFGVAIQAESIERALEIVARQNPGKECEVAFHGSRAFFVDEAVDTVAPLAA